MIRTGDEVIRPDGIADSDDEWVCEICNAPFDDEHDCALHEARCRRAEIVDQQAQIANLEKMTRRLEESLVKISDHVAVLHDQVGKVETELTAIREHGRMG